MDGYTKLFSSIITSTIWQEDNQTRILWITMLALSDPDGRVEGSIPGLARMAGISITECQSALDKLKAPDPYSRTKENEGRRVQDIDGGWIIINRVKYRDKVTSRSEYYKHWRKERNSCATHLQQDATQKEEEKEKEEKIEKKKKKTTIFVKPTLEEVTSYIKEKDLLVSPVSFFEWYETAGWVDNKGKPIANWKLKLLSWNSREKEKNPQQSPENINKLIHDATREADAEELDFLFGATKNG